MTITRISPDDAYHLMSEGYLYLDVRSEAEFDNGHPEGAYNVPLLHQGPSGMVPNEHFVTVVQANFEPETKLVLGCRGGNRSMNAAQQLIEVGYTKFVEQRAGFAGAKDPFGQLLEPGWKPKGLPVALTPLPGHSYGELAAKASIEPPDRVEKSGSISSPPNAS